MERDIWRRRQKLKGCMYKPRSPKNGWLCLEAWRGSLSEPTEGTNLASIFTSDSRLQNGTAQPRINLICTLLSSHHGNGDNQSLAEYSSPRSLDDFRNWRSHLKDTGQLTESLGKLPAKNKAQIVLLKCFFWTPDPMTCTARVSDIGATRCYPQNCHRCLWEAGAAAPSSYPHSKVDTVPGSPPNRDNVLVTFANQ